MSFALRSTAAAALLALGAVGTAHAVATASAEIGQVTITLIDLDPLDGITPMLTFLSEQSSSYASVYDGGTSTGDSDWAAGFYMPTSATAIDVVGWGTGSTGAGGAQGAAEIAGSPTAGVYSQTSGQGYFYGNFELTPWTGLILTTNYAAQADTSVGWVANDQTEYAGGYTPMRLSGLEPVGHRRRLAVRQHRRAHQRHRLEGLRAPDPGRASSSRRWRWRASRSRTARRSSTSTWTRPCSTAAAAMVRFLNLIAGEPEIARVPIMIDSSKWEVIEAGLKCIQGKGIVNSISAEGRRGRVPPPGHAGAALRRRRGGDGLRREGPGRHLPAQDRDLPRAYRLLVDEVGFPPEDIIFDPNIFAIATGIEEHDNYAVDFIEATRWIKQHLPGAKVSGGVSNVSFSFRGNDPVREAIHTVFLYHAIQAGHGHGHRQRRHGGRLRRPGAELRERVEDVVLNRRKTPASA
jgi:hypothetical protein